MTTSHTDHALDRVYAASTQEQEGEPTAADPTLPENWLNNEARQGVPAATSPQRQLQNRFFQRKHVSSLYPEQLKQMNGSNQAKVKSA